MNRYFVPLLALLAAVQSARAQVDIESLRGLNDTLGWSGNAGIDASVWIGNTDVQLLAGTARANYRAGSWDTFLALKGEYGWNNGAAFSDAGLAHLRFVLDASEDTRVEFFLQTDYNKKRLLLFRSLAGGGLRFHLLTDSAVTLRCGVGAMFENERYRLPATALHPVHPQEVRITSYLSAHFSINDRAKLASIVYYQPSVAETSDYRILAENSLTFSLTRLLDFTVTCTLRDDHHPPDGTKPTDLFTDVGLAVKW